MLKIFRKARHNTIWEQNERQKIYPKQPILYICGVSKFWIGKYSAFSRQGSIVLVVFSSSKDDTSNQTFYWTRSSYGLPLDILDAIFTHLWL